MECGARNQDTIDFPKYLDGLDHVLDGYSHNGGVKAAIFERQFRVGVEVVDYAVVQLGILVEFDCIQSEPYQATDGQVMRHVRAPAGHQVEDVAVARQNFAEVGADRADRGIVDVDDKSRLVIKEAVIRLIGPPEQVGWIEALPFALFQRYMTSTKF